MHNKTVSHRNIIGLSVYLFVGYLMLINVNCTTASDGTMTDKMERICKEVVIATSNILYVTLFKPFVKNLNFFKRVTQSVSAYTAKQFFFWGNCGAHLFLLGLILAVPCICWHVHLWWAVVFVLSVCHCVCENK
jgi:hypothetical protein